MKSQIEEAGRRGAGSAGETVDAGWRREGSGRNSIEAGGSGRATIEEGDGRGRLEGERERLGVAMRLEGNSGGPLVGS